MSRRFAGQGHTARHLGAIARGEISPRLAATRAARRATEWLEETGADPGPDHDVNAMFLQLRRRLRSRGAPWRPQYAWPLLQAARTAAALGLAGVSAIEFGVAGGSGLIALESIAFEVQAYFGLQIAVFGFDTGRGMPAPGDPRDAPFAFAQSDFAMDEERLRKRLKRAELILGPVGETIDDFIGSKAPPVAFAAFDVDYYSSTTEAFALLNADSDVLLPRTLCYFDDVDWWPWTDFIGERAAITDFNAAQANRKLSPLRGLRYILPRSDRLTPWPDRVYVCEAFDHDLYSVPEKVSFGDHSLP